MKYLFTLICSVCLFGGGVGFGQQHFIAWSDKFHDNIFKVQQVGFSSDSRYVAMGYRNGEVRVYTVDSGILMRSATVLEKHVYCTKFLPGTSVIACGDGTGALALYDFMADSVLWRAKAHDKAITAMAVGGNGSLLLTGSKDKMIKMWRMPKDSLLSQVYYRKGKVQSLYLAGDNQTLIAGVTGINRGLRMFDMNGEAEVNNVDIANVEHIAVSPDGSTVAVAALEKKLMLFNLRMNRVVKQLKGHKRNLADVCYDNTGRVMYSVGRDNRVLAWLADGSKHMSIFNAKSTIDVVACSPDGKYLIAMATSGVFTVINVAHIEEELKVYVPMELEQN